jgi:hypothetical protein
VQSLHSLRRGRAACHHADGRCAISAFNASCPIRQQTGQGHPKDDAPDQSVGEQCARAERRTVLIIPSTRSFPCTPRIRRSRASGHKNIAPAANICGSKRYILYVHGPTCRGPVPLCMPPFSYKREGMRRYTQAQSFRLTQTLTSSYKLSSNTSHSGVGCYAPVARTTLNPCAFLCFFPLFQLISKTPRPLLILGFRAGALRHPTGDLLSNIWRAR